MHSLPATTQLHFNYPGHNHSESSFHIYIFAELVNNIPLVMWLWTMHYYNMTRTYHWIICLNLSMHELKSTHYNLELTLHAALSGLKTTCRGQGCADWPPLTHSAAPASSSHKPFGGSCTWPGLVHLKWEDKFVCYYHCLLWCKCFLIIVIGNMHFIFIMEIWMEKLMHKQTKRTTFLYVRWLFLPWWL